jgi:hypothetical protein
MPKWERTAQDRAEEEHPPPEAPQDEPAFRPAWGPAIAALLFTVALLAYMFATGWSFFS